MTRNLTPTTWYAAHYSEYNHTYLINPVQVIKHTDTHVWLLDPDNPKHWLRRRRSLPTLSYFPDRADAFTFILSHIDRAIAHNLARITQLHNENFTLSATVTALESQRAERSPQ